MPSFPSNPVLNQTHTEGLTTWTYNGYAWIIPITGGSGTGGSGIVIVRYSGSQQATGGTITSAAGYTIHTFTGDGTFTSNTATFSSYTIN